MSQEQLVIEDLSEKYLVATSDRVFKRLYEQEGQPFARIFAYFHDQLNKLFDFLNKKKEINNHFNADESRQLLDLIREIEDARQLMKQAGFGLVIDPRYKKILETCTTFLVRSGGSSIPAEFGPIEVIRYERIFHTENKTIEVRNSSTRQSLKVIGSGAFAVVQRYLDEEYGFYVAVKTAKKNLNKKDLARFRNEFDLLKRLNHPYILQAYSYDEARNRYTMEYCEWNLQDYVTRNNTRLTQGQRRRIALQYLYGLNYLHFKKILHRDISRTNALVREFEFSAVQVKLSDFGLHKAEMSELTTTESSLKGTIIDPTLASFKDYAIHNEIYSIGVVLSFIFSGKKALGSCQGAVEQIIGRCTEINPDLRYRSVRDIIRDIESLPRDLE
ncbi:hypothetical protein GCM10029992_10410 [Glycomyces albus]